MSESIADRSLAVRWGIALLPLVAVSLAVPAGAQVRLGVFGGPGFSRLAIEDLSPEVEVAHRTGVGFGAVLAHDINQSLSLELQPRFVSRGASLRGDGEKATARIGYFEVPLLLKVSAGGAGFKPYLLGGPVMAFRRGAKVEMAGQEEDVADQVKQTDFAVALGGGLTIPAGQALVFVEGQYHLGLRDIEIVATGEEPTPAKNRGFLVQVGLTFPTRRR